MSSNELKQALRHISGAENLTINYAPGTGNLLVTVADRTVEVHPAASNAEIAAAFANPTVPTRNTIVSVAAPPAPTSATLPVPRLVAAPITQVRTPKMSITGAVNAGMTIKDLIASSRNSVQAAHDKLRTNAGRVQEAAAALNGLGDDIGNEADELMSMIGQFKNDLTPSTPAAPAVAPAPPAATPLPAAPALVPA